MVNLLIVEDDIAIHQLLIDILESETSYQLLPPILEPKP